MFLFVIFLLYFGGTTHGFSQYSLSPILIARHSQCSATSKNKDCIVGQSALTATSSKNDNAFRGASGFPRTRRDVFGITFYGMLTNLLSAAPSRASASSDDMGDKIKSSSGSSSQTVIAYQTISLPVAEFGIEVPVSIWYPVTDETSPNALPPDIKYEYKISLRRIGQLLAKWEFIPEFVSKDFSLTPSAVSSSAIRVVDGKNIPIAVTSTKEGGRTGTKVVFLAHGFLGSRSDLGYIAEELASQGFVCVAPEYPESLEASYPRLDGLDRAAINGRLIPYVTDMVPSPILSYSAIGHSLGCGTVLRMGDNTWNRVLMGSGRAPESPSKTLKASSDDKSSFQNPVVGGRLLFISSVNDGPVTSWGGGITIPDEYTVLQEQQLEGGISKSNLNRVAVVFKGEKAPNHISYLSENVNDAMLAFLSPLLPVTKALNIPVLDFDKYADSRDSVPTGKVLKPLISSFLAGASEVAANTKS